MTQHLFYYPTDREYRALFIDQDEDGTWSYEWKSRCEGEGYPTEQEAYATAVEIGKKIYPGITPA